MVFLHAADAEMAGIDDSATNPMVAIRLAIVAEFKTPPGVRGRVTAFGQL